MVLVYIFAFLEFLFSMYGAMCLLAGLVLFLALPMISAVSRFKSFSGIMLKLAALPIDRAAFVVSEHNDVLFKPMKYLNLGVEQIKIDGDKKLFEDPDESLHHWLGMKFGLADEEHGVLFDPRHAAAGNRKQRLDDNGRGEFQATDEEWSHFGISVWKPGTFEFPTKHELVDLAGVQHLIDGGERSEFPDRVEELYQHSRAPLSSGGSSIQYLMPVFAFGLTFGGIWILSSQLGGPSSTVSYTIMPPVSALATLPFIGSTDEDGETDTAAQTNGEGPDPLDPDGGGGDGDDGDDDDGGWGIIDRLRAVDWGLVIGVFLLSATPLAAVAALIVLLGPILGTFVTVSVILGMAILPVLTILTSPSQFIAALFSSLYFKLGFLGYRQPVLEWTRSGYQLREYGRLETTESVKFYEFSGGLIGFTFKPGPESWGAEVIEHSTIEAAKPAQTATTRIADGGRMDSNLPADVFPTDLLKRDKYGGYLPKRLRDDCYYLHSGILLNRFANSAIGEKSQRKLLEAKEVYGTSNEGLADATMLKATALMGLLGALLASAIFLLPGLI